jgi:hypothetical protein
MTRRYGRALRGTRVDEEVPAGHWRTLTVLGAVSISGWVAAISVEAATDGDVFRAFLEHVLCPQLSRANWSSWITWEPTKSMASENGSNGQVLHSAICRLTHPISTPLRSAGLR